MVSEKQRLMDEKHTIRDRQDALDRARVLDAYGNTRRCIGGRIVQEGYTCPHCSSNDPTNTCANTMEDIVARGMKKKAEAPKWEPNVTVRIEASCEIANIKDFQTEMDELIERLRCYGSVDKAEMDILAPKTVDLLK
jgi:hypothetical protein